RDYRFHYSSIVLVGCALATVEAIAWISKRAKRGFEHTRNALVLVVLVAAFICSYAYGTSPIAKHYREGMWPLQPDPRVAVKDHAVGLVPKDGSLSTAYNIAPHVTHRDRVYEFPVPWCNINWGVRGEHLDDPADVDWLLIDRTLVTSPRDQALLAD